jgi:hypothetical protein
MKFEKLRSIQENEPNAFSYRSFGIGLSETKNLPYWRLVEKFWLIPSPTRLVKHPEAFIIKTGSGAHTLIGPIHSEIPNRSRLPIPPPIATNQYLRIS